MARYHFITAFRVGADRSRVWQLITEPQVWPSFWSWLRHVDLLERADDADVGARHRYEFGTALPYTLSFETRIVSAVGLAGAVGGDLLAVDNRTVSPSSPGFYELPATQG